MKGDGNHPVANEEQKNPLSNKINAFWCHCVNRKTDCGDVGDVYIISWNAYIEINEGGGMLRLVWTPAHTYLGNTEKSPPISHSSSH